MPMDVSPLRPLDSFASHEQTTMTPHKLLKLPMLAALRWRTRARPVLRVEAIASSAWATAFLLHWSETLREDCDRSDILDWAGELYPTHGHLRPEVVAQSEWESLFDEDGADDEFA